MPTDAITLDENRDRISLTDQIRTRSTLRFALAVVLAMGVAQGIGWPLSQMAPLFTAMLLVAAQRAPTLAMGLGYVLVIIAATAFGLGIAGYLVSYPVVCVLAVVLLQFLLFHAGAGGASSFVVSMALISVSLLPLLAQTSPDLAEAVATGLFRAGLVAVLVLWVAFALVPPPSDLPAKAAVRESGGGTSAQEQLQNAVRATAVVAPLTVAFLIFNWGAAIVLIFALFLGQQPSGRAGIRTATGMVLANVGGGVAAIIAYNLLVAVPSFAFLLALIGLFALLFGSVIFQGGPKAPLWSSAFTTMLILIGGSVTTFGEDAGDSFYTRLLQVMLAGLYIAGAFHILETFGRKPPRPAES